MPVFHPGVTCRIVSILRFAKTYVKILRNVRYFYVLRKWYVKIFT